MNSMNDVDAIEAREWLDALDSVDAFEGVGRIDELLSDIVQAARRKGAKLSFAANSAYVNTIPPSEQPAHPGDRVIEHKIRSIIRWNADLGACVGAEETGAANQKR